MRGLSTRRHGLAQSPVHENDTEADAETTAAHADTVHAGSGCVRAVAGMAADAADGRRDSAVIGAVTGTGAFADCIGCGD